jgi:hypothetical protein
MIMKYDDLVDKFSNVQEAEYAEEYYQVKLSKVIGQILYLHKPIIITLPDGSWGHCCDQCHGYVFPCKTIEAIQDGLQVG